MAKCKNDIVDQIIRYENGEMTDSEAINLFQQLIDDGTVWQLQGFYGRTAKRLIDQGHCELPE